MRLTRTRAGAEADSGVADRRTDAGDDPMTDARIPEVTDGASEGDTILPDQPAEPVSAPTRSRAPEPAPAVEAPAPAVEAPAPAVEAPAPAVEAPAPRRSTRARAGGRGARADGRGAAAAATRRRPPAPRVVPAVAPEPERSARTGR